MKGYKIRQAIEFSDSRACILKVITNLDIYEDLIVLSHEQFQRDEDIAELGLYLCWDNGGDLVCETCLLKRWMR